MVPFLVLLPLVERTDLTSTGAMDLLSQLGPTALETLGSLGLLLLGGRIILRRVFEVRGSEQPLCAGCTRVSDFRAHYPAVIRLIRLCVWQHVWRWEDLHATVSRSCMDVVQCEAADDVQRMHYPQWKRCVMSFSS